MRAAAERSDAARGASSRRWKETPAKRAERPSHGGGKTGSCRLYRQAKRAASVSERRRQGSSPEGRRPRSGLRGAGRGEAAPGGIEPGDRSEGPGGRPYHLTEESDDTAPSSITDGGGLTGGRDLELAEQGRKRSPVGGVECDDCKRKDRGRAGGGVRSAAAICRSQNGEPPRRGRRVCRQRRKAGERPSMARMRRAGGEASSGGARQEGAAKRDTGHGAKKGPIPRRSEGPALRGVRRAALMRRRG